MAYVAHLWAKLEHLFQNELFFLSSKSEEIDIKNSISTVNVEQLGNSNVRM